MEPSREDKSKSKHISAQFSWQPCIERQVSSTSHRERIAFLGVGRARKRALKMSLSTCIYLRNLLEWRQIGSWGWQRQVLSPLPSQRDRVGPVKPNQQCGDHQESPCSHQQVQDQAQCVCHMTYEHLQLRQGQIFSSRRENMNIQKFLLGDDSEMDRIT